MSEGRSVPKINRYVEMTDTKNNPATKISVVIPNHNGGAALRRCLDAVCASAYNNFECIVVDDSSTDQSVAMMKTLAVQVVELPGGPFGPSRARNVGAQAASGDVLFFFDADVVVYPDTLQKVADAFSRIPDLTAVFGSYDDLPGDGHFLSQYKNLFHHFVHQQAREESRSFWSGCGAIRREVFLAMGGFDVVKYPQPSIEDIELGRRLSMQGHTIVIDKTIQVKHLKRWTLSNLIKTDIFSRGIPWTQLILADRAIPNDLNLETSQRWSALLSGALLIMLTASMLFFRQAILLPVLLCLFLVALQNWRWDDGSPRFEIDRSSILQLGAASLLFASLSLWLGFAYFLSAIIVLLAIVLLTPLLTKNNRAARRIVFSLTMTALGVIFLQIVAAYPLWLIAAIGLLFGLFVILNRKFYLFFIEKRGIAFAAAVIPFHMLYFLYSVAAFALGVLIYYRNTKFSVSTEQVGGDG